MKLEEEQCSGQFVVFLTCGMAGLRGVPGAG